MPDEPATRDDAGAAASRPAVHVHDAPCSELRVDRVERAHERLFGWDREVADRDAEVACWSDEVYIRPQLAVLGEIEEEGDPAGEELIDLCRRAGGVHTCWVASGEEPAFFDPGRWTHRPESAHGQ